MISWLSAYFRSVVPHADHEDPIPELAPIAIDDEGWRHGAGVVRIPSKRSTALIRGEPDGVVAHWTATAYGTGRTLANRIREMPQPGQPSSSWHIAIDADGTIYQSVSLRRGSWHANSASAFAFNAKTALLAPEVKTREKRKGFVSANSLFVGIEHCLVGEVRRVDRVWSPKRQRWEPVEPQFRGWPFAGSDKLTAEYPAGRGPGPAVPAGQVREHGGRHYHDYPEPMRAAHERIVEAMYNELPRLERRDFEIDHQMIDPSRKTDAGPLWTKVYRPEILDRVFGAAA